MLTVLVSLALVTLPDAATVPLTVQVKRSECSSSFNTAYIKFKTTMHCTWDYRKNGCYGTFDLDLNETEPDGLGGLRRKYLCLVPSPGPKPAPLDIESELSGVKVSYPLNNGTLSFNRLQFTTWVENFHPTSSIVTVGVWTNWRNNPDTMVDDFDAEVTGELIWTTNSVSRLIRRGGGCGTASSSICGSVSNVVLPAGEVLGGTAFSSIIIGASSSSTTTNVGISSFRVEATSAPRSNGYSIRQYGEVVSTSPVGVSFGRETLTLVGQPQEVVRLHAGPFSETDSQPSAGSVVVNNVPLSALRCGLRSFKFETSSGLDRKLGAFSAGLDSRDCGWDPSLSFVAYGFWDWRLSRMDQFNATTPYIEPFIGEFGVEATRLP